MAIKSFKGKKCSIFEENLEAEVIFAIYFIQDDAANLLEVNLLLIEILYRNKLFFIRIFREVNVFTINIYFMKASSSPKNKLA